MGKGGNSGVQNFSSCYPSPYLPYPHHLFPWTISVLLVNLWFLVQLLQFLIKMFQTCQHFSTFLPPLATHICFANVTRHFQKQKVVGPSFPKISVSFKTSVFSEYLFQSVTRHFQQKVVGPHSLTHSEYCAKSRRRTNLQDKQTLHILSTLQMTALWTMLTRRRNF